MYNISICDDDRSYVDFIERIVREYSGDRHIEISKFYSSKDFIDEINKDIDLVFMDYEVDEMNGVEISRRLRDINPDALLVFITGEISPEPVFFELNTFRFILKSFDERSVSDTIKGVMEYLFERTKLKKIALTVRTENEVVDISNIVYAFKLKYGTEVVMLDEISSEFRHIVCKDRLQDIYDKVGNLSFAQPHSSYIVNLEYLKSFGGREVIMADNSVIGISKSRKNEFTRRVTEYFKEQ